MDYAGHPCDYVSLTARGLVLQDGAHGLGSVAGTGTTSAHGNVGSAFSLHPAKLITAGEGGVVTTDDSIKDVIVRQLRDHGRSDGLCVAAGFNYRMSELHAALALSQLRKMSRFLARRREIAAKYVSELAGRVELPAHADGHAWHLYVIRVEAKDRDSFRERLADRGVGSQVHYRPVCCQPRYRAQFPKSCDRTPIVHREWQRIVSIPLSHAMTDAEVDQVIRAVREVI